jgi:hypothetical protein
VSTAGSRQESIEAALAHLRSHTGGCADCSATPLPLERLAPLLAPGATPGAPAGSASRVLQAAAPLLAINAAHAYRRRVATSLLLSLAPLPVVVFFNVYLLERTYAMLVSWLPGQLVAGLVVAYGSMLLLLTALTYASLPLLIARRRSRAAA